jgi:hypothetical protein
MGWVKFAIRVHIHVDRMGNLVHVRSYDGSQSIGRNGKYTLRFLSQKFQRIEVTILDMVFLIDSFFLLNKLPNMGYFVQPTDLLTDPTKEEEEKEEEEMLYTNTV